MKNKDVIDFKKIRINDLLVQKYLRDSKGKIVYEDSCWNIRSEEQVFAAFCTWLEKEKEDDQISKQ